MYSTARRLKFSHAKTGEYPMWRFVWVALLASVLVVGFGGELLLQT
jgi:hypothetical protein